MHATGAIRRREKKQLNVNTSFILHRENFFLLKLFNYIKTILVIMKLHTLSWDFVLVVFDLKSFKFKSVLFVLYCFAQYTLFQNGYREENHEAGGIFCLYIFQM